ncbi:hypothetical protein RIF23_14595 [Lipingzhangella sp. LS1_29]|uniref:ATP-grasp domain-containing protein n=1 Tax=Lipingzhangella rawalii TaxID=2055835 RepID=A0ABU2H892_9ACTN|nr:hypothetical protein [Lipingzhangella rawalii]MDS1271525.1 hypothetical protein [Lipingzhangella rawalii]
MSDGKAYWQSQRLDPEWDIIVYDIRSGPTHQVDLWQNLTTVRSLDSLGFWSAIPLSEALLFNDKFATAEALRDAPLPVIPSVRLTAGRDIHRLGHGDLIPDAWFPVFIKPVSWGRGLGCVRCADRPTLDAVLGLASGSGAAMLVQPSVGEIAADVRVVVVEGEIVAVYDRVPGEGSHVANISRGGSFSERTEIEPAVRELVDLVYARYDLSYLCIDLLRTSDGALWFSEVEPDGAVSALFGDPEALLRVVGTRFRAYAARLDAHLARTLPSTTAPEGVRPLREAML